MAILSEDLVALLGGFVCGIEAVGSTAVADEDNYGEGRVI